MILAAALGLAAACGAQEGEKVVIVEPTGLMVSYLPIYAEPGALGGTNGEVNMGEFARILERRTVGVDVQGAKPGEWVRIRTIIQPREGWIEPKFTRPAAEN
jgi:hypothetical protein